MTAARFRPLLPEPGPAVTAVELVAGLDVVVPPDRPSVVLNMIATLDGRIAVEGRAGPLANRADFELFHALRDSADAVMAGAGTVRAEGYGAMDQVAVVVSSSLRLAPSLGLLRAPGNRVVVVTDAPGSLEPCAAHVDYLRRSPLDLPEALRRLRSEHGVRSIVCEGGAHLNAALLRGGLVDELHLVLSPMIVGGSDPLTVVAGPLPAPPLRAELTWLLESDGYLFSRYRFRATSTP